MDDFDLKKYLTENKLQDTDEWEIDWNEKALDKHIEALDQEFGEDIAVNIGWGVDELELAISSKIYNDPKLVLTTYHDQNGDIINQEIYEY